MGRFGAGIVLAVARLFARGGIADFAMVGAVLGAPALAEAAVPAAVTLYRLSTDAWLPAEFAPAAQARPRLDRVMRPTGQRMAKDG